MCCFFLCTCVYWCTIYHDSLLFMTYVSLVERPPEDTDNVIDFILNTQVYSMSYVCQRRKTGDVVVTVKDCNIWRR